MIKAISKAKAKEFFRGGGWFSRIEDWSGSGTGEITDKKRVKITPHETYFEWQQIEPVMDKGRCYYSFDGFDADILGVYDDRGKIVRVCFDYKRYIISYER